MECKMMEEVRVLFVLLEESRCSGCLVFGSRSQLPSASRGEGDGELTRSSQMCSMASSLSSSDDSGDDETSSSLRE